MRLGVKSSDVSKVIIWGNHSSTQYPDVQHGFVMLNGQAVPITEAVKDDNWIQGEFLKVLIYFILIIDQLYKKLSMQ